MSSNLRTWPTKKTISSEFFIGLNLCLNFTYGSLHNCGKNPFRKWLMAAILKKIDTSTRWELLKNAGVVYF